MAAATKKLMALPRIALKSFSELLFTRKLLFGVFQSTTTTSTTTTHSQVSQWHQLTWKSEIIAFAEFHSSLSYKLNLREIQ